MVRNYLTKKKFSSAKTFSKYWLNCGNVKMIFPKLASIDTA